ncbi:putative immunity protein [Arthrobacter sp. NIO-1057]|uniref:putative immunity protein n=1 Tax=Arthrobacter sp. NIO-1057 TaxID=993071 RepID=UPI000817D815|nr:hypothetical protein GA0061084_2510 [Arthrobacter sp. NIO-1057]
MILPAVRDPRLISVRRGGTLSETDHRLLAVWAATCAEHVLPLLEGSNSEDTRPRVAVEAARTWASGQAKMMDTRAIGGHAMGAARPLRGAARFAAYAAGQAACVAHVPEHDLGAAAYAIKAVQAAAPRGKKRQAKLSVTGSASIFPTVFTISSSKTKPAATTSVGLYSTTETSARSRCPVEGASCGLAGAELTAMCRSIEDFGNWHLVGFLFPGRARPFSTTSNCSDRAAHNC